MTTLFLSVDKSIAKGGEIVKFTASYPGEVGKNIILVQKGLTVFNEVPIGNALTNSSGVAVISWKGPTVGTFHFYAVHSIIPGISSCGIWCEMSSEVSVSITDAPCDPADILCKVGGGIDATRKDMQLIIAAAIIIAIVLIFFVYLPKKR